MITNLCFAFGRKPIAYTKLPGNHPDVVTVKNAITQMNALGLKTAELVTDNGYHSQQNLSELLLAGFDFLTLVKTSLVWVRDEIDRHRKDLDGIMTACPFDTSTHGVTVMLMREFQVSVSALTPCRFVVLCIYQAMTSDT